MSDTEITTEVEESADERRARLTKEFDAKIEVAERVLYRAREAELVAKSKMKTARNALAEALLAWQRTWQPITIKEQLEAMRDRDIEAKLAGRQPMQTAIGPSILDATLAHGRGGGSPDQGLGRRPRRGTGKSLKGYRVPIQQG